MTDITELAQSLKAAAIDAKELAIIARYSKGRAAAEKFYALANPNNVIALVEALEKAQQQTTESENRVRKQNRHICELFDDNTALRQRIAELESRTVKLPESFKLAKSSSGLRYYYADEVDAALTASGIK
ncbi:TPA: hypothetical protein MAN96_004227, partial [Klebsiella pneumoniae]|nr:hypothetical protein [Klebsiella pneumoniae]